MIDLSGSKSKYFFIAGCALTIILLALSGLGLASEGGGHGGGHDSGKLMDLLYRCINFALLVIILFVVIKKTNAFGYFSSRREEIEKKLEDLQREKGEAESRYIELEKKFKEFEIEKKEIIEQFKADGLAEKEKIITEAKERANQILAQADLTIQRGVEAARTKIRQEVVDVAAQKAQEIVEKEIKDSDQDHLINEFIASVEKLH